METRKITIVQTRDQKKNVIMSAATTLAELKRDLRANNIDYTDMTFFEGTSKIELKNDDSVLPHDVPYKGTITNELVFMLTNTNKKIKSGAITMSRIEAYNAIKSMGLQDACVKQFGKNFTMCKTADLITLIQNSKSYNTKCDECVDNKARVGIKKLTEVLNEIIEVLNEKGILGDSEKGAFLSVSENMNTSKLDTPYSDDEIDDMFNFVD